ncbi:peptidyl-dipeptidase Dcp [Pseudoclavibacter endophyticus]|uniref:M3 family metallopeptidase n=1 Tax=Pseudoclavibacter endophyticus TaxID=1778590 RepID=UPI00199C308F|nr:M3 family metallopeptidase [Pseudoclavibacter endophyticus]GGA75624.1 peptidyl-dipeptidase Dcp [Pseudoclavibacter endophyticus]
MTSTTPHQSAAALPAGNPFAAPSELPCELPPFERIRDEHFLPAFDAGFAQHRAEIEAIASNPEPATFANTIEALERSGELLARVSDVFWNLTSAHSTPALEAIEREISPRSAQHADAIFLNGALAQRVRDLASRSGDLDLTPEQAHVLERTELEFRVHGAALDDAVKVELADINTRLAALSTRFEQRLLAATADAALVVDTPEELDGLDEAEIEAAREAARAKSHDGYRLPLVLFTAHPALARLTNRDVRRRLFDASVGRAAGGEHDSTETVLEIVRLRARRAELIGFPSHSELAAAESTAGSPTAIADRLELLATPAARNARREREVLQAFADELQDAAGAERFELESWDWPYYAELVRSRDFDLDAAALRPYFGAERVLRDGVFWAASQLYGLTFAERDDLVGYHPDVRVFEVGDADGQVLGLYLLDLFAREEKSGGAWMSSFRQQNELLGHPTVIVNVLNVPKPAGDAPTLLTLDEVTTLYHEFGHALHGLLAHVVYPSSGGTSVPRDFVEFPSQVNEMWMLWPEVVRHSTAHVTTGAPLPDDLIDRLEAASTFNQGFETVEYLAASVIDQAWHTLSAAEADAVTDIDAFEAAALTRAGLDVAGVRSRYHSRYFKHVFAGGYAAGYYGYIWSEVLDADTVEWFREHGGLLRTNGDRFRQHVLGVGGSRDAMDAVRAFLGREPRIEPLLERRGLTS